MKKINILLFVSFFATMALIILGRYPETMLQMEASDFFVWTSDYLQSKWAQYPCIPAFLNDYILQYFRWEGVGACVLTMMLAVISMLLLQIPRVLGTTSYNSLALLLPLVLTVIAPFQLQIYLEVMFMLFFLLLFLWLMKQKSIVLKSIGYLSLSWLAVFFIHWIMLLVAAFIMVVATAVKRSEKREVITISLIALCVVVINIIPIRIASNSLGFIPFEQRWVYCPVEYINGWIYFALLLVFTSLLLIPVKKGSKVITGCVVGVVAFLTIFVFVNLFNDENLRREERAFRFASLADKKEWKQLLEEIPMGELTTNRAMLLYALLAEEGLGTLPEHLFNYPIIFSFNLNYYESMKDFCCNYNRQYYELLGIYDECYRQSLEYGVVCKNGQSFAALRNMTKYALLQNDAELAEQTINLLSHSTTHKEWARRWTQALKSNEQKASNRKEEKPLRAPTYTNAMARGLEMLRQMENGHITDAVIDQALLGFLMDCDLNGFLEVFKKYHVYANKPLPKAYAEAMAMIIYDTQDESLRNLVSYSQEFDEKFKEFDMLYSLYRQGKEIDKVELQKFHGSYWNYYIKVSQLNLSPNADHKPFS